MTDLHKRGPGHVHRYRLIYADGTDEYVSGHTFAEALAERVRDEQPTTIMDETAIREWAASWADRNRAPGQ